MKIIIDNKKIVVLNANNFKLKLLGLMFERNIDYGILFPNCNSIHTFFMYDNIDVIMLDNNNKILYLYPNFKKNKILYKKEVTKILELPKNSINNLHINDILKI